MPNPNNTFQFFKEHFYSLWQRFPLEDRQILNVLTDYGTLNPDDIKRWQDAITYMIELWRKRFGGIQLAQASKYPTLIKLSDFIKESGRKKKVIDEDTEEDNDSGEEDDDSDDDVTILSNWDDVANANMYNEFKMLYAVEWAVETIQNSSKNNREELIAYDNRIPREALNTKLSCQISDPDDELDETVAEFDEFLNHQDATLVLKYAPIMKKLGFTLYTFPNGADALRQYRDQDFSGYGDAQKLDHRTQYLNQSVRCRFLELVCLACKVQIWCMTHKDENGETFIPSSAQILRNRTIKLKSQYEPEYEASVTKFNNDYPEQPYHSITESIIDNPIKNIYKLKDAFDYLRKTVKKNKNLQITNDHVKDVYDAVVKKTIDALAVNGHTEPLPKKEILKEASILQGSGYVYLPFFRTKNTTLINVYKNNPDKFNSAYKREVANAAKSVLASYAGSYLDRSQSVAQFPADIGFYADPPTEENSKYQKKDLITGKPNPDGSSKQFFTFQSAAIKYFQEEMINNGKASMFIADDMGLGKTQQALGIINNNANIKKSVIAVHARLQEDWIAAIADWLVNPEYNKNTIKVFTSGYTEDDVAWLRDTGSEYAVCLISYEAIKKPYVKYSIMSSPQWNLIAIDESHTIANPKANITSAFIGQGMTTGLGHIVDPETKEYRQAADAEEFHTYKIAEEIHKLNNPNVAEDIESKKLEFKKGKPENYRIRPGSPEAIELKMLEQPTPEEIQQARQIVYSAMNNIKDEAVRRNMFQNGDMITSLPGLGDTVANKLLLTGTPIKNKTSDMYAQLLLLDKPLYLSMWPTIKEFEHYWTPNKDEVIEYTDKDGNVVHQADPKTKHANTKRTKTSEFGMVFRSGINVSRNKKHVLRLKEKIRIPYVLSAEDADQQLIEILRNQEEVAKQTESKSEQVLLDTDKTGNTLNPDSEEYATLIGGGFQDALQRGQVMAVKHTLGYIKQDHVLQIVSQILNNPDYAGDKIVLFGYHQDVVDYYYTKLREAGVAVAYYNEPDRSTIDANTKFNDNVKQAQIDDELEDLADEPAVQQTIAPFKLTGRKAQKRGAVASAFKYDDNIKVFVSTMQIAKEGLTLTRANHMVFGEIHFVPGVMIQAEDRINRIGQTKPTYYHYITFDTSYDSRIAEILFAKMNNIENSTQAMQAIPYIQQFVTANDSIDNYVEEVYKKQEGNIELKQQNLKNAMTFWGTQIGKEVINTIAADTGSENIIAVTNELPDDIEGNKIIEEQTKAVILDDPELEGLEEEPAVPTNVDPELEDLENESAVPTQNPQISSQDELEDLEAVPTTPIAQTSAVGQARRYFKAVPEMQEAATKAYQNFAASPDVDEDDLEILDLYMKRQAYDKVINLINSYNVKQAMKLSNKV
jgi:SNF2 family DNA or RNA helicase